MWRPRAQVSLVTDIATLFRFIIGLRECFYLQDESHCQNSSECRPFTYCLGGDCSANQHAFSMYEPSMKGFKDTPWPVEWSPLTGNLVDKAMVELEQWH
jgi:hypothetical protein